MTAQAIAIVGRSDSGKTRIATALIRVLSKRGYRILAVKHSHHTLDISPRAKDSARLFTAGATRVIASSPTLVTSVERVADDLALEQIVSSQGAGYDFILAEGFKASPFPKVVVLGRQALLPWPDRVIAVVTDVPVDADVPVYSFGDAERLAHQVIRVLNGGPRSSQEN